MSQGNLGSEGGSSFIQDEEEDELSRLIREFEMDMLNEPVENKSSNSSKKVESITKLSEAVTEKVPLRFRLAEKVIPVKKGKINSLAGAKPNTSTPYLLEKFETLKGMNETNRVSAEWWGKSNYEKDISDPVKRFLNKASKNIKEKKPMPPSVFKDDYMPLHTSINKEIAEQKEKKNENKMECAKNVLEILSEAFRLWRNLEQESESDLFASLEHSGQLDYIRSLASDPEKFKQEKRNLGVFLSQIDSKYIAKLFITVIDPEKGIETPELAGMIMNKVSTAKWDAGVILNYLKPYPKLLEDVLVGTMKVRLEKEEKNTFLRDTSPTMQSLTLLAKDGLLKDFHNDSMDSLNDAVLELTEFKIDPKVPVDEKTAEAYTKFIDSVIDKISVEKLPDLLLRHCEDINHAQLTNIKALPEEAAYSMVTFLMLRVYSPMIVSGFPEKFTKLIQQTRGRPAVALERQKEAFVSHATIVTQLLQAAANKTAMKSQPLLEPLRDHIVERLQVVAFQILDRINSEPLEEIVDEEEPLQEIVDEEEPLQEIVDEEEPLQEIVDEEEPLQEIVEEEPN